MDGYVLLHNRRATNFMTDNLSEAKRPFPLIAEKLKEKGALVSFELYGWGETREQPPYGYPMIDNIEKINSEIERLRSEGAERVFLLGTSFGAIAATFYATYEENYDGLIFLGLGGDPSRPRLKNAFHWSIEKANALIEEGNDEPTWFGDCVGDKFMVTECRPSNYVTYFDVRNGLSLQMNAVAMSNAAPVLWIDQEDNQLVPVYTQVYWNQLRENPYHKMSPYSGEEQEDYLAQVDVMLEWAAGIPKED